MTIPTWYEHSSACPTRSPSASTWGIEIGEHTPRRAALWLMLGHRSITKHHTEDRPCGRLTTQRYGVSDSVAAIGSADAASLCTAISRCRGKGVVSARYGDAKVWLLASCPDAVVSGWLCDGMVRGRLRRGGWGFGLVVVMAPSYQGWLAWDAAWGLCKENCNMIWGAGVVAVILEKCSLLMKNDIQGIFDSRWQGQITSNLTTVLCEVDYILYFMEAFYYYTLV